jgi:hypothetical protein
MLRSTMKEKRDVRKEIQHRMTVTESIKLSRKD